MRRAPMTLIAGWGLVVALAAPASAALWAVVTVSPPSPTAGVPAEVLVRTFATFGQGTVGEIEPPAGPLPAPSGVDLLLVGPPYPYEVRARGPAGREIELAVAPDPGDASLYRGTATFPEAGSWVVWLPQFGQPSGPGARPGVTLRVDVLPAAAPVPQTSLLLQVALAAIGILAVSLLARLAAVPRRSGGA